MREDPSASTAASSIAKKDKGERKKMSYVISNRVVLWEILGLCRRQARTQEVDLGEGMASMSYNVITE